MKYVTNPNTVVYQHSADCVENEITTYIRIMAIGEINAKF